MSCNPVKIQKSSFAPRCNKAYLKPTVADQDHHHSGKKEHEVLVFEETVCAVQSMRAFWRIRCGEWWTCGPLARLSYISFHGRIVIKAPSHRSSRRRLAMRFPHKHTKQISLPLHQVVLLVLLDPVLLLAIPI